MNEEQLRSIKIKTVQKEENKADKSKDNSPMAPLGQPNITINVKLGDMTQTTNVVTFNNQIIESFNNARLFVNSSKKMTKSKKRGALKKLDELENEAKKEKPNKKLLNTIWNWIKQNADQFVVTALNTIITEVFKRAI